jgi:TrmH family RNA methyltransferase
MITSTKNPRIVDARKLTQRKHRQQQNCFLVEGLQLLALALEARAASEAMQRKIIPRQVFYNESLFTGETAPRLLNQLIEAGAEAIAVVPNVLDTLSKRDVSQGLAVTFDLQALAWSLNELEILNYQLSTINYQLPNLLLILDQLQDPGNLGTLIRAADAVGAQAVILLEPCVDPFDPKTLRSAMGSIFTIPLIRTQNAADILPRLAKMGYDVVGADAKRGVTAWQSDILAGPVALVLGNEARGLSPELHQYLTGYVSLPLRGYAESLNVSVAGGVLMYEWLRINS